MLIFHGGFSKTGTSFLQKSLFRSMSALGNHSQLPGATQLKERVREHFKPDDRSDTVTRMAPAIARDILNLAPGETVVYSDENLFLSPGWISNRRLNSSKSAAALFIEKLKALCSSMEQNGSVRVLVTVRSQSPWLASYYAQISNRIRAGQADFERRVLAFLKADHPQGAPLLEYDRLLQTLVEAVGADNVLMLPMELMADRDYWTKLVQFLGCPDGHLHDFSQVPRNRRRGADSTWLLRASKLRSYRETKRMASVNSLVQIVERSRWKILGVLGRREIELTRELEARINQRYRESNEALQEMLPWDLQRCGYIGFE